MRIARDQDASMQWLYETLLQRGVKLKPVTILGQGTDLRVFAAPVHTGSGGYAH